MKFTTLNKIKSFHPCKSGWEKLLKHLGKTKPDDELLPFEVILDSNGLDDAVWCMRSAPEYDREWRLFAVWCARQVQHLNSDMRVSDAIDAAEAYANGQINMHQLSAADSAAGDAAWDAAGAARAAAWAARAAAWDAAGAARAAAWAAEDAAEDAAGAARDAAAAARAAAREMQKEVFRWIVNGGLTKFEKE